MIVPAQALIVLAGVQAAGAAAAEVFGMGHLVSGGLSVCAVVSAVGAVYVTREKTRRNERDIERVGASVEQLGRDFSTAFGGMRQNIREDLRDHREQTRETVQQLVDVIQSQANNTRAGEHR